MNEIKSSHTVKLPVKDGCVYNKSIEKFISHFEIVSFDVFDTLLFRKTLRPEGIFHYIECKTNDKGFAERRIKAEEIARNINFMRHKSHETTLTDIYQVLYEDFVQQTQGMERELDAERHFLRCYTKNKEIYDIARSLNKKIIAISDMYLPAETINEFLEENGIFVDEIFCSSTYYKENIYKGNGSIYPLVCRELNISPEQIVHFGDNYNSDLAQSISSGISAVHTSTVMKELLSDSRLNLDTINIIKDKNNFESNIILGLMAKRHTEGYFDKNPSIKMFGYLYSGLLMIAFIKNILEISKKENIKKLLLMTRDGFVIKRVMDALGISDIDYEIFWSSRRMCLAPLLSQPSQYDLAFPILFPYRDGASYNLKNDLERLYLKVPVDFQNIEEDDYATYIDKIKNMDVFWSHVIDDERDCYLGYLEEEIGSTPLSQVAFVDVGWGLSSHQAIDALLNKEITGFYVGTSEGAYATPKIHGILFQEGKPTELSNAIMSGVELVELMFSDSSPSAIRMKKDGQTYYPVLETRNAADVSRDWYVHEIHHYMMDFISDISPYFSIMSADTLKDMSAESMFNIITNATSNEQEVLGEIPHAREVGHSNFLPISNWWRMEKPHVEPADEPQDNSPDPQAGWTQAEKDSFALYGRILPRSEKIGRQVLNPIVGKNRADWLIKTWNRNKRKIKSYMK